MLFLARDFHSSVPLTFYTFLPLCQYFHSVFPFILYFFSQVSLASVHFCLYFSQLVRSFVCIFLCRPFTPVRTFFWCFFLFSLFCPFFKRYFLMFVPFLFVRSFDSLFYDHPFSLSSFLSMVCSYTEQSINMFDINSSINMILFFIFDWLS